MKFSRYKALFLSLALFAASLYLPAATSKYGSIQGIEFLVMGPMGFFIGEIRWIANIFLLFSWIFASGFKPPRAWSVKCASIALALGASCILFPPSWVVGGGSYSTVETQLALGCYLWIAAQALALISNFLPLTAQGEHDVPAV